MGNIILLVSGLFLMVGCAHIKIQAPKEPIKLDVSMRLDIYQHIESDINQIENKVDAPVNTQPKLSLLDYFISDAEARELSPEAESAIIRRQARHEDLFSLEHQGVVGENKSGLLEIKGHANHALEGLLASENNDRMIIYKAVADKNGISVDAVQNLYAKRLQSDAPSGTPIQSDSGWSLK